MTSNVSTHRARKVIVFQLYLKEKHRLTLAPGPFQGPKILQMHESAEATCTHSPGSPTTLPRQHRACWCCKERHRELEWHRGTSPSPPPPSTEGFPTPREAFRAQGHVLGQHTSLPAKIQAEGSLISVTASVTTAHCGLAQDPTALGCVWSEQLNLHRGHNLLSLIPKWKRNIPSDPSMSN